VGHGRDGFQDAQTRHRAVRAGIGHHARAEAVARLELREAGRFRSGPAKSGNADGRRAHAGFLRRGKLRARTRRRRLRVFESRVQIVARLNDLRRGFDALMRYSASTHRIPKGGVLALFGRTESGEPVAPEGLTGRDTPAANRTVIGSGARFVGDLSGEEDVVVDGRFEGTIRVAGSVQVGPSGEVQADVSARRGAPSGEGRGP